MNKSTLVYLIGSLRSHLAGAAQVLETLANRLNDTVTDEEATELENELVAISATREVIEKAGQVVEKLYTFNQNEKFKEALLSALDEVDPALRLRVTQKLQALKTKLDDGDAAEVKS